MQPSSPPPPSFLSPFFPKESRQLYCLLLTALFSLLIFLSFLSPKSSSSFSAAIRYSAGPLTDLSTSSPPPPPPPPSFAYFISGSDGDGNRILRLLQAVYHPKNLYLLHLDRAAPQEQRDRLARAVRSVAAFRSVRNVHVVGNADFANPRGCSALAATLHGAAVLLRIAAEWDWFVNLDASDYPLVTQDDLLHVFSFLPRDLNFIQHTNYIGWRESRRIKPIIVDPGLYLSSRTDIFYATQKRELPNAYRLFTGSSSVILSRKFIEYCILGTDNLPRTLLMYYSNMPSPQTNYFQTVLCNSPEFNRKIVNDNLHHVTWDTSPNKEPRLLNVNDFGNMTQSGAVFGTRFTKDDPVLDRIDREVLSRGPSKIVPGGWCLGGGHTDPCSSWGNPDILRPGPGARKLANVIVQLLSDKSFHSHQCILD